MSGPQVAIDLGRIERNARTVVERCAQSGIKVFGVTKGMCGMPQVARAMLRGGVAGIAESRFENIRRLRDSGINAPIMLLRSPPIARVEEVVRTVDISLQSELSIIREIARIAERMGRVHDIMLMVDLGDLREGIWPNDLVPTVEQILEMKGVRIAGIGTNLGCFGAILPTEENLGQLVAHAYKIERLSGKSLDWISGGASSSLPLLLEGRLPAGINNLRVGEAILQGGLETFRDPPWEALELDACRLTADIIEVKKKPSRPIGQSGYDAFGNQPVFPDEGDRLRAITNIGREDVLVEGLMPIAKGVRVLGASSDHLLLDVQDADPPPVVGGRLAFRMSYGAMLLAMTSEYVEKAPMHDVEDYSGRKMVSISAEPSAAGILAREATGARLEAMNFDVVELADAERPPSGLIRLTAGADRRIAHTALAATARATHSFGLIWIDSIAALMPEEIEGIDLPEASVLARMLGLDHKPGALQPQLSPENIVIVGLRHADPAEARVLADSRVSAFTMTDIDATGMGEVMREAIHIASSGTQGFHVAYAPEVTEFAGWAAGSGGLTVRETHQAMEAVALSGGLLSMSVSGFTADLEPRIATDAVSFVMSAFGKRIL
ncbi:alanine racemase [Mesorhizobium sp. M4B.F.Ca.ET.017.02.2.1]|uniref:alanine racemase n=1 Tax=Mesorhizobium sp. M4B.F.Ca.ET.017.02.2.1 TaxID=2496649 RepID=UPI000FCBB580|nr:alanine racemase [Mesorhizobium sp. M4B.F.Ca.ET.017.02.2.1]RVD31129.1 alanine racemase [Mesorhizobium sp. M4B.F.Ca.ET.017.02.2.1]